MNSLTEYPSYVSPARIRTLVIPIGKWKKSEFINSVNKLKDYSEIRLLDITPIDSSLFTPQGFPKGRLLFDFSLLGHNDSLDLFLYDFEPFRKTFIIIGLVNDTSAIESNLKILKDKYQTAISFNLIYTNDHYNNESTSLPNIFTSDLIHPKNLETILCDIGRNFLEALTQYYSSYKHVTLRSPGAIGGISIAKAVITRYGQNALVNPTDSPKSASNTSKRMSSFEITTNNIKRSASIKLANSLSTSDTKAQQKSKGRQLKILGNFQLLAGRYSDALRSFTESVTLLYKLRDFLWLASAMDGVAICFISLSYLNVPFQIPELIGLLCPVQTMESPNDSRESLSKSNVPRNSISTMQSPRNSVNITASFLDIDVDQINLPRLISSMSEKVLYYYELSLANNSEYAPNIVYCNFMLKTLTFVLACHGSNNLSPEILENIVKGKPQDNLIPSDISDHVAFTKEEIYLFANRLFDLQLKSMSVESQFNIYCSLAQVFKVLGFKRKQAFVLRLLLVGLFSSAEQLSWSTDHRKIIEHILDLYGVSERHPEISVNDAIDMTWLSLQKNALNLCLLVANKFKDTNIVSKLSLQLITDYTHLLNPSEQQSLLNEQLLPCISDKSISTYWDPFIVRGGTFQRLEFDEPGTDSSKLPIETAISNVDKSYMTDVSLKVNTEEVFNPFKDSNLSTISSKAVENFDNIFLVGDKVEFTCTLQNPFKFDLNITDLQFDSEVFEFCELKDIYLTMINPYIIKAESLRRITIPVLIKKATTKKICNIDHLCMSIFGLPLQKFKIVLSETRKKIIDSNNTEDTGNGNEDSDDQPIANERCRYKSLNIKIFPEQPQLQVMNKSNTAGNSLMILDGTKTKIIINIRNKSLNCAIDYLKFHAVTNIEVEMKSDYWKNLQSDELYALEKQLTILQDSSIKILNAPKSLQPGEDVQIEVEVDATNAPFDFTEVRLVIKYGMTSFDANHIYLKELVIPYEVTIRKTVEVASLDIISLNEKISDSNSEVDWISYIHNKLENDSSISINDFVLLLLDFRNSWLDGLYLKVEFDDFASKKYLIEANHALRMIIPVRKIEFTNNGFSKNRIPNIVEGRQFIQSGLSGEQEIEMRESFWCREYIFDKLKCDWKFFHDNSISGSVDFRKFLEKFDSKMVSTIYKGKSPFNIQLKTNKTSVEVGDDVKLTLKLDVMRKNTENLKSGLRTLNIWILDHNTSKILPKSNRKVLYNGTLSREVQIDKSFCLDFELFPVERGIYEICAAVARQDGSDPLLYFDSESFLLTVN